MRPTLAVLLCLLAFGACKKASPTAPSTNIPQEPKSEISSLEQQINLDLDALGLPYLSAFHVPETPRNLGTSNLSPNDTSTQPVFTPPDSNPTTRPDSENVTTDPTVGSPQSATPPKAAQEDAKNFRNGVIFNNNKPNRAEKKAAKSQCEDACNLIKNICQASERICQIAKTLPEPDAPKRCERAQLACERAKTQGQSCGCKEYRP